MAAVMETQCNVCMEIYHFPVTWKGVSMFCERCNSRIVVGEKSSPSSPVARKELGPDLGAPVEAKKLVAVKEEPEDLDDAYVKAEKFVAVEEEPKEEQKDEQSPDEEDNMYLKVQEDLRKQELQIGEKERIQNEKQHAQQRRLRLQKSIEKRRERQEALLKRRRKSMKRKRNDAAPAVCRKAKLYLPHYIKCKSCKQSFLSMVAQEKQVQIVAGYDDDDCGKLKRSLQKEEPLPALALPHTESNPQPEGEEKDEDGGGDESVLQHDANDDVYEIYESSNENCRNLEKFKRVSSSTPARKRQARRQKIGRNIDVPDTDFHDFDQDRTEKHLQSGQIWAIYDESGMPRFYGRIVHILSSARCRFKVNITWLQALPAYDSTPLSPGCGKFKNGSRQRLTGLELFSHKVDYDMDERGVYSVFPKKGQVWAIFKSSTCESNQQEFLQECKQDLQMVEVTVAPFNDIGVCVASLEKVDGFKSVYRRQKSVQWIRNIKNFSHRVPAKKLSTEQVGEHCPNQLLNCWELDLAAICWGNEESSLSLSERSV